MSKKPQSAVSQKPGDLASPGARSGEPSSCDTQTADQGDLIGSLAERFYLPLLAYFTRRVPGRGEAEDLTQEVFMRVIRRSKSGEGARGQDHNADIDNPEAFLFSTAANLLRDRARRARTQIANYAEVAERENTIEVLSPERVLLAKEALQSVMLALGQLGERTRDIFLLHRLENMKYREIAEFYGISQSAVEKHMIKALAHLAKRVDMK